MAWAGLGCGWVGLALCGKGREGDGGCLFFLVARWSVVEDGGVWGRGVGNMWMWCDGR